MFLLYNTIISFLLRNSVKKQIFFLTSRPINSNISKDIYDYNNFITQNKINFKSNVYEGYDKRCINITDLTDMNTIKKNFYKKNILDKLVSVNIDMYTKLKYVDEYYSLCDNKNKYIMNLNAGGLFNDWNFTSY